MRGRLKKMSIFLISTIVVLGVIVLAVFLLQRPPVDPALEKGLQVSKFTVEDATGQTELTAQAWQLPSENAEPPKGVILMSHGFSATAGTLRVYAAQLARAGYVVAAVTHDDLKGLRSGLVENDPMVARQRHLQLLLEQLYASDEQNTLRTLPVGILGYSLGGYAALTSTAFPPVLDKQPAFCETQPRGENILLCNPRFGQRIQAILSQDPNAAARSQTPAIPASAIALFAPAYTQLVDMADQENTPAVFLANGQFDEYVSPTDMQSLAQSHSYIKAHKELEDAGHYVYLPSCPWPLSLFMENCKDPKPIERAPKQAALANDVVAFFDENLVGAN
ncbi:alpha/beta hydrolase family protein [Enterovibrio norvegicus]|uniref:alpha/beta hydrolase family protein n=1 Tax=Enterovibrio norvegicus TaxID=188144 RepID=UPI003551D0BA